jgi:alpha-ketoglutarate-dependent taurine dioxygenase
VDCADVKALVPADHTALAAALHKFGLLKFSEQLLQQPSEMVEICALLAGTREGMITHESTPVDFDKDCLDPTCSDCRKAHLDGWPMVRRLGNAVDEEGELTGLYCETGYEWHTDSPGNFITSMYCVEAPTEGGETLFASSVKAYAALSPAQQEEAAGLEVFYSNKYTGGGPSAYDCHHGLRMSQTGARLLRQAITRRLKWRLGRGEVAAPMVQTVRVQFTNATLLLAPSPSFCLSLRRIAIRARPVSVGCSTR